MISQPIVSRKRALLYLCVTALLWSTGGLLIKLVDLHPLAISGWRSLFSALFLGMAFRLREGRSPSAAALLKPQRAVTAVAYAGVVTLFVLATKLTTAANAILLQYTAPVYVALFSASFLGERIRPADWIIILIVMAGLILFFLERIQTTALLGNLAGLGSGVCFAWFALLMRRQKESSPLELVFLGNAVTVLLCLPFTLARMPDARGFLGLLVLGFLQLGLSYLLYSEAVKSLRAMEMILIPTLEPLLNPVWVFLFLGETPGLLPALGGMIVLGAITVRGFLSLRERPEGSA